MRVFLLLALALAGVAARPPPKRCLTSMFGAQPSEAIYATDGLQAALDYCKETCGTVVVDKPGTYLTGTLRLTDCVHLEVPAGVTLLAGTQRGDYPGGQEAWYLLRFDRCSKCSVTGGGAIDGNARKWVLAAPLTAAAANTAGPEPASGDPAQASSGARALLAAQQEQPALSLELEAAENGGAGAQGYREPPTKAVRNWDDPSCPDPQQCRPRLVGVVDSTDVVISGISIKDPVYTALGVFQSDRVTIQGVKIAGDFGIQNTDGIILDGSRYVHVKGAEVDVAGDGLGLQASSGKALEHVDVADCRLRSRSSAVRLGQVAQADIRYVSFKGLTIDESARGLAIQLRDKGSISHISFSQVSIATKLFDPHWWPGQAEPIYVTAVPRDSSTKLGAVFEVSFKDVRATGENGIFLAGGPMGIDRPGQRRPSKDYSLSVISLERVSVELAKRSIYAGGCQDYRPSRGEGAPSAPGGPWWPAGLDCKHGGTAPIWVSGAQRVSLKSIAVRYSRPARKDWLRQVWIDPFSTFEVQTTDVVVSGLEGATAQERPPS
ncbi:hypothetical protein ABPG75_010296 [Micractinium tetrahymenae]